MQQIIEYIQQNAYALFQTTNGPLTAKFDNRGFFFSHAAQAAYNLIEHQPHLYIAFTAEFNTAYVGKSFQKAGRWKRSHYYHLGTLAYHLLGTIKPTEQNHSRWIDAWFSVDTMLLGQDAHSIELLEEVFICFLPFETYYALQDKITPHEADFTVDEMRQINTLVERKFRSWFITNSVNPLNRN
ncbi:MAG TPA: hypothetical protein VL093_00415 [Flavipsychrobacter sp.]|nr:hypothetical protein [Flavipsychrobacter sp.]